MFPLVLVTSPVLVMTRTRIRAACLSTNYFVFPRRICSYYVFEGYLLLIKLSTRECLTNIEIEISNPCKCTPAPILAPAPYSCTHDNALSKENPVHFESCVVCQNTNAAERRKNMVWRENSGPTSNEKKLVLSS